MNDIRDYKARIIDAEEGKDGKLVITVTAWIDDMFGPRDPKDPKDPKDLVGEVVEIRHTKKE